MDTLTKPQRVYPGLTVQLFDAYGYSTVGTYVSGHVFGSYASEGVYSTYTLAVNGERFRSEGRLTRVAQDARQHRPELQRNN